MIENRQYRIGKAELSDTKTLPERIERLVGDTALRWYIAHVSGDEVLVEATSYTEAVGRPAGQVERRYCSDKSVALSIIPTGIGCDIGGYAGDAAPVTNLLASSVDYLITNPNAVNASDFVGLDCDNIIYTDGYSIDLFCKGIANLHVPYSNKIGIVIERAENWKLDILFNLINAVRSVHGVQIEDFVITDGPIGSRCVENKSGTFVGTVDNPEVLFRAAEKLIKKGANAIAITSDIQDLPATNYARHFNGEYPNPVGGAEAVISYMVVNRFQVPAAHAPLMNMKQLDLRHNVVDARGSGEMASPSGLACLLVGLRRAPQLNAKPSGRLAAILNISNLLAIIAPASSLGGVPSIYAQMFDIPIIAVKENRTILDVTHSKLMLSNVIEVNNYAEAAGVLLALRKGISLESISRPLRTIRY